MQKKFKDEIKAILGGERVNYCYQCGTCTACCPSARFSKIYNPRQFILKALLGMKENILNDKNLWLCTTCHTCGEECPQKVKVDSALVVMRTIAVREGYVPESFCIIAKTVADTGRTVQSGEGVDFLREKVGLKPLNKTNNEDVIKIMKKTGLYEILEKKVKSNF